MVRSLRSQILYLKNYVNTIDTYLETMRYLHTELGDERYEKLKLNVFDNGTVYAYDVNSYTYFSKKHDTVCPAFRSIITVDMIKENFRLLEYKYRDLTEKELEELIECGTIGVRDISISKCKNLKKLRQKFVDKFTVFSIMGSTISSLKKVKNICSEARRFLECRPMNSKQLVGLFHFENKTAKNEELTQLILDFSSVFYYFLDNELKLLTNNLPVYITCQYLYELITGEEHARMFLKYLVYKYSSRTSFPLITANLALRLALYIDPKEIELLSFRIITENYIFAVRPTLNKSARK